MERDIIEVLREDAGLIRPNLLTDAADAIERLTAERDEARRQFCELMSADYGDAHLHDDIGEIPRKIASGFGWDCFKEDRK
jgi:hypothetical protein